MAVHVWTEGEAITASKLNAIERKRAFRNGEIPLTTLTYNEAVELIEELGMVNFEYMSSKNSIYDYKTQTEYHSNSADSLLTTETIDNDNYD